MDDLSGLEPRISCWDHLPAVLDDEGHAICRRCGASYRPSPTPAEDFLAVQDLILRRAGCMTLTERQLEAELERP